MSTFWKLFEIAINMFQCALTLYFGLSVFEPREKYRHTMRYVIPIWCIDTAILSMYTFFPMPNWLPNIIPAAISFLIWTGIFRADSIYKKLLWCLIYFAVYAGDAYLVMTIALSLPGMTPTLLSAHSNVRIIYVLTVNATYFFTTYLLIRIARRSSGSSLNIKVIAVSSVLIVTNLLLLLVLMEYAAVLPPGTMPPAILIISAIALIIVNILVLWMFQYISRENERMLKVQAESQLAEMQLRAVNSYRVMDEELRQFRHDSLSSMQYLLVQMKAGDYDAACAFIENDVEELTEFEMIRTGNRQMDYIVSGKAVQAKAKGVKMAVDMLLPPALGIEETDLMHLMGNLLDNAIEASAMVPDKDDPVVAIQGMVNHGTLTVMIENSMVQTSKRKGLYAMTSKKDANWHGLGLHIVKKVIAKYGGHYEQKQHNASYTVIFTVPIVTDTNFMPK